jgi:spore germination cell wall hydrolase CwlJ-like protein
MNEHDLFVSTIILEAGGEPLIGQRLVAGCISLRATIGGVVFSRTGKSHPLFGRGSISDAILAPKQFSCWNGMGKDDISTRVESIRASRQAEWMTAQAAIASAVQCCTHYHSARMKPWPLWAATMDRICLCGNHIFYIDTIETERIGGKNGSGKN